MGGFTPKQKLAMAAYALLLGAVRNGGITGGALRSSVSEAGRRAAPARKAACLWAWRWRCSQGASGSSESPPGLLGFGILRRSRQLLLHCSTFAHPRARTSCVHAVGCRQSLSLLRRIPSWFRCRLRLIAAWRSAWVGSSVASGTLGLWPRPQWAGVTYARC